MGASDKPARQRKAPALYKAGPASGRINPKGSSVSSLHGSAKLSSSSELSGSESPPASAQLQQSNLVPTPPATAALRPNVSSRDVLVSLVSCYDRQAVKPVRMPERYGACHTACWRARSSQ